NIGNRKRFRVGAREFSPRRTLIPQRAGGHKGPPPTSITCLPDRVPPPPLRETRFRAVCYIAYPCKRRKKRTALFQRAGGHKGPPLREAPFLRRLILPSPRPKNIMMNFNGPLSRLLRRHWW